MNRPKYKLCDACRRNEHKVAVRYSSREVSGYCPSCFDGERELRVARSATASVVYDLRGRKFATAFSTPDAKLWHRTNNGKVAKCGEARDEWALDRWTWLDLPDERLCRACLR